MNVYKQSGGAQTAPFVFTVDFDYEELFLDTHFGLGFQLRNEWKIETV